MLGVLTDVGARRYALVIGIGDYPANSGWHKINGDKDIPLVQEILLSNHFEKREIITLQNEQATCSKIKTELEKIITQVRVGDDVYIHFSGHGQQITDLNGDEPDGLDESWVPYDAQFAYKKDTYEGQNHITDDQINAYLHRIRRNIGNKGKLVFVSDACHSGDITREEKEKQTGIRGTSDAFIIPQTKPTSFSHQLTIDWIVISACQSNECNREYKGKGSLTQAMCALREKLSQLTSIELDEELKEYVNKNMPFSQTPYIEYNDARKNGKVL
jgi:hypothetical protein